MKLSSMLSGTAALLPFALVAQAQGLGDAQRGAQYSISARSAIVSRPGRTSLVPACTASLGARPAACGYAYSPAMKNADVTWNDNTLSKYLTDPKAFIPGDKMPFLGIKDPSQLGDLLAYLHQATQ